MGAGLSTFLLTLHVEASESGLQRHLLGWRRNAQRSDGGGVPATVHVLVHLLGNLLRMTKVGCCHGNSVEEEELRCHTHIHTNQHFS